VSDVVIGQRFGVAGTTIARALSAHPAPDQAQVETPGGLQLDLEPDLEPDVEVGAGGAARVGQGVFFSR